MEDLGDSAICVRPLRMRPQATALSLIDRSYARFAGGCDRPILQCSIERLHDRFLCTRFCKDFQGTGYVLDPKISIGSGNSISTLSRLNCIAALQ
jgi:hypothetical protein